MKSRIFAALLALILVSMPDRALTAETPRPIAATAIYNGNSFLYVPASTPFANRACSFDNNSAPESSITTSTELTYLHGVTSPIQTQINAFTSGSRTVNTVTATFTIPPLTKDYLLYANTSSGGFTVTLSNAVTASGLCESVKNIGSPVNPISVVTQLGQHIDYGTTDSITGAGDSTFYCSNGTNWFIN